MQTRLANGLSSFTSGLVSSVGFGSHELRMYELALLASPASMSSTWTGPTSTRFFGFVGLFDPESVVQYAEYSESKASHTIVTRAVWPLSSLTVLHTSSVAVILCGQLAYTGALLPVGIGLWNSTCVCVLPEFVNVDVYAAF